MKGTLPGKKRRSTSQMLVALDNDTTGHDRSVTSKPVHNNGDDSKPKPFPEDHEPIATSGEPTLKRPTNSSVYCCIPSCISSKSSPSDERAITFHRFPKNPERHSAWVTRCFGPDCTDDWLNIVSGKQNLQICSNHFTPADFSETHGGGPPLQNRKKRSLKTKAVPSIGLPNVTTVSVPPSDCVKVRSQGSKSSRKALDVSLDYSYGADNIVKREGFYESFQEERKLQEKDPLGVTLKTEIGEPFSVKLKRLREEGKKRILQLIKENEEIYKCPIHKIISPTCSIENCVLRAKRKPSYTKNYSVSSKETTSSQDLDNGNREPMLSLEEPLDPLSCVDIKTEDQNYEDEELLTFTEDEQYLETTGDALQMSNYQTIVLKVPNTTDLPSYLSENNPTKSSVESIKGASTKRPMPTILKRQSCVDSFDTSSSETNLVDVRNSDENFGTSHKSNRADRRKCPLVQRCSDGDLKLETLVYRPIKPALHNLTEGTGQVKSGRMISVYSSEEREMGDSTGAPTMSVREQSEKLSKIRKIDRLISENNLLIGKLGLDKRKSCASSGEGEERKSAWSFVEGVDQGLKNTDKNSNKENRKLANPVPPLAAIGPTSQYEAKIREQNAMIKKLLDRISKLEIENIRLKLVEKENEHLRAIIAEQSIQDSVGSEVEDNDSQLSNDMLKSSDSQSCDVESKDAGEDNIVKNNVHVSKNNKSWKELNVSNHRKRSVASREQQNKKRKVSMMKKSKLATTADSKKISLSREINSSDISEPIHEQKNNVSEKASVNFSQDDDDDDDETDTCEEDVISNVSDDEYAQENGITEAIQNSAEQADESITNEISQTLVENNDISEELDENNETSQVIEELHETSQVIEEIDEGSRVIEELDETSEDSEQLAEMGEVGEESSRKDVRLETSHDDENKAHYIDPNDLQEYIVLQSCTQDGYTEVQVMRNEDYVKLRESGMMSYERWDTEILDATLDA